MTRRLCLSLDLVEDRDLITEYEKLHQPGGVWPEVLAHIRASGVHSMQIWRTGNRMVMVSEVEADYPRPTGPTLSDAAARWEALMDRFQRRLPQAGPGEKWHPMDCIFDLDQHQAAGPGGAA